MVGYLLGEFLIDQLELLGVFCYIEFCGAKASLHEVDVQNAKLTHVA